MRKKDPGLSKTRLRGSYITLVISISLVEHLRRPTTGHRSPVEARVFPSAGQDRHSASGPDQLHAARRGRPPEHSQPGRSPGAQGPLARGCPSRFISLVWTLRAAPQLVSGYCPQLCILGHGLPAPVAGPDAEHQRLFGRVRPESRQLDFSQARLSGFHSVVYLFCSRVFPTLRGFLLLYSHVY